MESNPDFFRPDMKLGNVVLCQFYNDGRCFDQTQKECKRPGGNKKHACSYMKASTGKPCGGSHMRTEHDTVKHGN